MVRSLTAWPNLPHSWTIPDLAHGGLTWPTAARSGRATKNNFQGGVGIGKGGGSIDRIWLRSKKKKKGPFLLRGQVWLLPV